MSGLKNLKVLKSKEIKQIRNLIREQWGAELDENLVFFLNTKENKVFITNPEIAQIHFQNFNINTIGLYLGELQEKDFRPSIEGAQLIGKTATQHVLEIAEEEALSYLQGKDLEKETDLEGYIILRTKRDIIGTSIKKENKLLNFYPKTRRLP